jgi:hypothetical protein
LFSPGRLTSYLYEGLTTRPCSCHPLSTPSPAPQWIGDSTRSGAVLARTSPELEMRCGGAWPRSSALTDVRSCTQAPPHPPPVVLLRPGGVCVTERANMGVYDDIMVSLYKQYGAPQSSEELLERILFATALENDLNDQKDCRRRARRQAVHAAPPPNPPPTPNK